MSFILDALKKSENERQRHVGPSLADVQVSRRERDRPWWVVAVAGLLVVNLGVLLIVLMRDGAEAPPTITTPAISAARTVQQPAQTPRYEQEQALNPGVRSLAEEAGAPGPDAAFAEDAEAADPIPASEGPPLVRRIEPGGVSAGAPAEAASAPPQEILPTLNDLAASGTSLPALHLDIHVHSTNAAERFVFVNMRKYVEGQTLNEGPAVERITSEGVILNHRGLRFLLPRQ